MKRYVAPSCHAIKSLPFHASELLFFEFEGLRGEGSSKRTVVQLPKRVKRVILTENREFTLQTVLCLGN
jgi:hypothetical protein